MASERLQPAGEVRKGEAWCGSPGIGRRKITGHTVAVSSKRFRGTSTVQCIRVIERVQLNEITFSSQGGSALFSRG